MKTGVTVKFTTTIHGPFANEYRLMYITVPVVENLI